MFDKIKIYDDFFNEKFHTTIFNLCKKSYFTFGEKDDLKYTIPTGMVSYIQEDDFIYKAILPKISTLFTRNITIERMYINLFSPNEQPNIHIDSENSEDITIIYYPDTELSSPNDKGETIFYDETKNISYGVQPIPNRLIIFPSNILHSASSFRNKWRFTIAIKITT